MLRPVFFSAALAIVGAPAQAVIYDPFQAFSVSGSTLTFPNFEVGDYASGVLTPATQIVQNGYAGVVDVAWGATTYGGAYKNDSGTAFQTGTVLFRTDRLNLHAGAGEIGLAFVAPGAGNYRFAGQWSTQDTGYPGKRVSAVNGAETVFAHQLTLGNSYDFDFTRTLSAGDRLVFVLGGPGYASTSTGIFLNVTPEVAGVPEPSSWAMMIAGFAVAGAAMRRRYPAALSA